MRKYNTRGIILGRTNYGEAARIITFLTPDHGKIKAMAKGVRKSKSKLAGGIELFSVSDIGVLTGRGDVDTLVSSRLVKHYGQIVKDLDRTGLTYELIKQLDKATAEQPEAAYFELLKNSFEALDAPAINPDLTELWFGAQLLKLSGHAPNLQTDRSGSKLTDGQKYDFNYDAMSFEPGKTYDANQIKYLRLLFSDNLPAALSKVRDERLMTAAVAPLVRSILQTYVRT
jgi:DNA repair protein RecO (recombination protein O)